LGVPYAQDTGGQNRFRVPQPLNDKWTGTRLANTYSHACPSYDPTDTLWGMSEDCLSINIVRPSLSKLELKRSKLPVLFFIHGGGYQFGTSGLPQYNLSYIVERSVELGRPILAASINYRKTTWGFLQSVDLQGTGNTNLGLRDMRQALSWVQENIAAFGGDPSSVTIWGQSAGASSVGQLLMAYGGRGNDKLFHRTIQESGSASSFWHFGTEHYQPVYNRILSSANCSDAVDTVACLRDLPYETLYPLLNNFLFLDLTPGFAPTVDGDIIPNYPTELLHSGRFSRVPHLLGTNSDEGTSPELLGPMPINTDEDLYNLLFTGIVSNYPASTVEELMRLYPDDPSQGVPINTGEERFAQVFGQQFKRAAAVIGDMFYHAPRLDDARHYAKHQPDDTFVYRFNTRPWLPAATYPNATYPDANITCEAAPKDSPGQGQVLCGGVAPPFWGVSHSAELPFVFRNPQTLGPYPEYWRLSDAMSKMWVDFVHDGHPNGKSKGRGKGASSEYWPSYLGRGSDGSNLVFQTQKQGGLVVEKDTYRVAGRDYLIKWARRRRV